MARVVVRKHEGRCVVCKSGRAEEFNLWLARRADGDSEAGVRVTWDYLAETVAPILLGSKADKRSLRRHFDNHCEVVSEDEAAEVAAAADEEHESALELFDRILGEGWQERTPTPDQVLELQRAIYVRDLARDVAAGRPVKLTHDQAVRAVAEATKRKSNEAQDELLRALGGGIGMVFSKALSGDEPAGELVEGELVAEEDDGDG